MICKIDFQIFFILLVSRLMALFQEFIPKVSACGAIKFDVLESGILWISVAILAMV